MGVLAWPVPIFIPFFFCRCYRCPASRVYFAGSQRGLWRRRLCPRFSIYKIQVRPPAKPPRAPAAPGVPTGAGSAACPATGSLCGPRLAGSDGLARELTREEKRVIRALMTKWCANYDRECGCLPPDCECYMLGKCWTGALCRYFREAVLPLDPALEAVLLTEGPRPDFKICPICGGPVAPDRRLAYCSAACAKKAHRRQQREYMRKKRGWGVDN